MDGLSSSVAAPLLSLLERATVILSQRPPGRVISYIPPATHVSHACRLPPGS